MSYKPFSSEKNVADFNIRPNTGLDSTSLFQQALSQTNALNIPEGEYIVGDLVLNGKTLYGRGTLIKEANAQDTLIVQGVGTKITGLTFKSTTTGVRRSEIKLDDGAQDVTISDCNFDGSIYGCITADDNGVDDRSLTYTNRVSNVQIVNNKFKGYVRPLYLHSVEDVMISSNSFRDTLRDAIRIRQDAGFLNIVNNVFKNIGEFSPSIVERPANWQSTGISYEVGDRVSVPPFGIYECVTDHVSTVNLNPATGGAALWTAISTAYFETMDAVDTFWSGKEMVISNNVIDTTASVGLDIKGSEPSGDYSTTSVIISNNLIKNTFGIGLNFHSSALLVDNRDDVIIPARTINLSGGNVDVNATAKYRDIIFTANETGTIGNSISLIFDGVQDIGTVVENWNTANPSNQVSAAGANANKHYYVGNTVINGNIFDGCNSERYDVAQPAVNLRQGTSNVTLSDNIIRNHFGRAVNITNLDFQTQIQRSIILNNNQLVDVGLPGHPGNIGFNVSPVDGLIVKNNIVENTNFRKPHKFVLSGTVPASGTLNVPTIVPRSDLSIDLSVTSTIGDVLNALESDLNNKVFPDDPSLNTIRYYEGAEVKIGGFASATFGTNDEVTATAVESGTPSNSFTVNLISDADKNVALDSPFKGIFDIVGNEIRVYLRTSATATNLLSIWGSSKNFDRLRFVGDIALAAGGTSFQYIRSNIAGPGTEFDLTGDGTSTLQQLIDASSQNVGVVYGNSAIVPANGEVISITNVEAIPSSIVEFTRTEGEVDGGALGQLTVPLVGGVDSDEVEFHSRLERPFRNTSFPITVSGLTLDYIEEPNFTNSVNKIALFLRESELVGSAPDQTNFSAGIAKTIIKDNIFRKNASLPRFEIQYNGQEIKAPTAYVTSNNEGNSALITTQARTAFSGGADSDAANHLNTLATLSFQGIILQARVAGSQGNNIYLKIENATAANGILRVVSAPITTINGYEIGGTEINVFLPSDGANAPIDTTVEEVENILKIHLNQSILAVKDNILE